MANRAYLGVWLRDFSEASMLRQFEQFLASAPLPPASPYSHLVVQAVDPSEAALAEWDLRGQGLTAAEVLQLVGEQAHADTALIVEAQWELWVLAGRPLRWTRTLLPLTMLCQGPEYDGGVCGETGHFHADLGFEHLFTGHARVLGAEGRRGSGSGELNERAFDEWILLGDNLREYHQKTRENIQQLMSWVRGIEQALPVEAVRLWSEGEENFEARLDEILAVR
jgi:hypothetical protein